MTHELEGTRPKSSSSDLGEELRDAAGREGERQVSGEDTTSHLPWDGAASSLRERGGERGREGERERGETCYDTDILGDTGTTWDSPLLLGLFL